ncbi:protein of unknown function DUF1063 [Desulfatibacillum aliphaticivorans]|uniref:UPF0597 protein Dalk_4447 n=1 Tax=Desulfatibacillum aliphaticivorans TaxID=218208 RepID=Y4447_DESAL|nr:L-serine ammonia-lyase, iron-sulfur-dependent, subunit alpha [Desulfatibacillum aliphaticivorans]B8FNF7.1 RecName: Full=UPF0597 protein Dalk_4447 [Desulfatibacillum aliphaticivorans]ACL06126.1 protein of unknown function DUF1063 [Desulfatibacillum aliphaticivorans]
MAFTVKDILSIQVAPALGCTEPAAVALCAAAAASLLPEKASIEALEVRVDPNIFKNGLAVLIPGTEGLSGLDMAAALGAIGGNPAKSLEVLGEVNPEHVKQAQALIKDGKIRLNLLADHKGLFIKVIVNAGENMAEAVVESMHDNITRMALDGVPVEKSSLIAPKESSKNARAAELESWLKGLGLKHLMDLLDDLDDEDLAFLEEGLDANMKLADYGLKHGPGLGVGKTLDRLMRQRLIARDMILDARILASAAADARMAGVNLPAMSSAGSGNHGLTAILPIKAVHKYLESDHESMLRAIGLSHIVTAFVKAFTGRLSAVCGCSVAAGAGATAGVTYLMGGNANHIADAIKNLMEDLAGIICDGAKSGCAFKLSTAAGTAVQAALFALQGVKVMETDGIIGASLEKTTQNLGALSTEGMIETDRTILKIMLEKQFSPD